MSPPHVTSFCCCWGLETGSKLIGSLQLLLSLALVIVCSVCAEDARALMGTIEDAEDHLYSTWYKVTVAGVAASLIHLVLAIILMFSIFKRNITGLKVWVYTMIVLFVCALLFIILTMVLCGFSGSGSEIFVAFLEAVLAFGVIAYCVLAVYSYSLLLQSSQEMSNPNKVDFM